MSDVKSVDSIVTAGGRRFDDHLGLLAEMARDFAESMDVVDTLRRALGRIVESLDAEAGALFLLDEDPSTLTCRACVGPVDITGMRLDASAGIVGRSVANNLGELVRDATSDPAFQGTVDAQTGFRTRSVLCAPMSVKETRIGAIEVLNRRGGNGLFEEGDLHLLMALSSAAGLAVINARMAEALVEQERQRRELELAADIQRSLLPADPPPGYPVRGINRAARRVSGDFYDFLTLPDGQVCFALGDASGKGMDAALLMAKTASVYRCMGKREPGPGRLLSIINREVCETASRGKFVTMACGLYDPSSGMVRLANAGHEPPLLYGPDGVLRRSFEAEAPPLGIALDIIEGDAFPEVAFPLDDGTLYIFSDGVTEGEAADGSMLGIERARAIFAETAALDVPARFDAMVHAVERPGTALKDDVTLLALEDRRR